MRTDESQAKKGSKDGLVGAVMGLALVAGAVLSMGGAPTKHARSFGEVAQPRAAEISSATSSISPGEAVAERDTLDLQLD